MPAGPNACCPGRELCRGGRDMAVTEPEAQRGWMLTPLGCSLGLRKKKKSREILVGMFLAQMEEK